MRLFNTNSTSTYAINQDPLLHLASYLITLNFSATHKILPLPSRSSYIDFIFQQVPLVQNTIGHAICLDAIAYDFEMVSSSVPSSSTLNDGLPGKQNLCNEMLFKDLTTPEVQEFESYQFLTFFTCSILGPRCYVILK
ncbi:unnamed protein product [Dovyalis caffra]|uniref:Uncharacterized protein n=1 Tax=Dovyalis caffra TaxID=77055 RepID=A0AAV1SJK7_9ROSI|nr:unnamed protein product [Dovyalis caffra]